MNGLSRFPIAVHGRTGWQCLALLGCLLISTSCSTLSPGRFYDGKSAEVILQFFGWESIYMTRPDTRQAGFLPLLSRDQVEQELKQRNIPRNLAVVVIGNTYSQVQVAQLAAEWKALLHKQGFRRVVLLRAGAGDGIDGLPIIEDSVISSAHDTQSRTSTIASLPPAAGADAAHSSVGTIR